MPSEKLPSATPTQHPTRATWPSLCHSCLSLPPSLYCHADAAYLCTLCDSSIHSANSLARRHHRVPIARPKQEEDEDDQDAFFIQAEVDQYFDLVDFTTSCEEEEGNQMLKSTFDVESEQGFKAGIDYSAFLPPTESISTSDQFRTSEGAIELFSGPPIQQFTAMDREARVLRYREKRKTRKFQKVIRYASRKAYAETRPRIKGRFAKRTDAELEEVDQMFAAPVMVEAGYGVVHSY